METSPRRRVHSALLGGKVDKIPVTSIAGCGGTVTIDMQKSTGIYLPAAHRNAELMAKLSISSHTLTGIENVRVPFDFVVEPEALGCQIKWWDSPETLPSVKTHPFKKPQNLKIPKRLTEAGRIPVILEAITVLRKNVGDFLPISSLALGPFSLAGELAGAENLLIWTLKRTEYVTEFVNFTTRIVVDYAKAQYQAGSDIVVIADPMASLDMISPNAFKEFVKPALAKIANDLGGLRILHICGYTDPILTDLISLGFDGISVEADVAKIKPLAGHTKILGNVSSKKTLILGSPQDVKAEAKKALEAGVDLLEPECGFSMVTPLRNIKALVESRDEYSR